jgi:hypothetical protein
MPPGKTACFGAIAALTALSCGWTVAATDAAKPAAPSFPGSPPRRLAMPVEKGKWIVPAEGDASLPVWGIKGKIMIGLWPTPGPRGLIRIFTPYVAGGKLSRINFIAIEPIVNGRRGYSEMEASILDQRQGKVMWATADRPAKARPAAPWAPVQPTFMKTDGAEAMTFTVWTGRFHNGAQPVVQVILRLDRPEEVTLRVTSVAGTAKMDKCVLTATMGNYARLRRLWLKGKVIEARGIWPKLKDAGAAFTAFTPRRHWGVKDLVVVDGEAVAAATTDEADPAGATYAEGTRPWWRYRGRPATQYWRTKRVEGLTVSVNGRTSYWANAVAIPGGIAFENFEMNAPFQEGQEFTFGVTLKTPGELKGFAARKPAIPPSAD